MLKLLEFCNFIIYIGVNLLIFAKKLQVLALHFCVENTQTGKGTAHYGKIWSFLKFVPRKLCSNMSMKMPEYEVQWKSSKPHCVHFPYRSFDLKNTSNGVRMRPMYPFY
jgi:hypothetical protein